MATMAQASETERKIMALQAEAQRAAELKAEVEMAQQRLDATRRTPTADFRGMVRHSSQCCACTRARPDPRPAPRAPRRTAPTLLKGPARRVLCSCGAATIAFLQGSKLVCGRPRNGNGECRRALGNWLVL